MILRLPVWEQKSPCFSTHFLQKFFDDLFFAKIKIIGEMEVKYWGDISPVPPGFAALCTVYCRLCTVDDTVVRHKYSAVAHSLFLSN